MGRDGIVRRAFIFRLRPTARQHTALAICVEAHRELYNAALQERRDGWSHSKTRIHYGDQSAQLTEIRATRADQAVCEKKPAASSRRRRHIRRRPRTLAAGESLAWSDRVSVPTESSAKVIHLILPSAGDI